MAAIAPDPARCNTAIKLLEQVERLARKLGVLLPPKRLAHLRDLKLKAMITSNDLPPTLRAMFPGEFVGMTLRAIREACRKKRK